jgi:hypothetical protein
VIAQNIREMQSSGHPHDQAVAAALHNAYDYRGGKVKSSDMNASQSKRFMEKGDVGKSTTIPRKERGMMNKGGEVGVSDKAEYGEDEKEMSNDKEDADLHEGVMKEMGDHLKNGNHKEALESFKALVNSCHNCKD